MADTKNVTEFTGTKEDTTRDESLVVKLSKEYTFEGEKISEIDLSRLEDVTTETILRINKLLAKSKMGAGETVVELSLPYALLVAEECTSYPIEFFKKLRPRDAMRVRETVVGFLYVEE